MQQRFKRFAGRAGRAARPAGRAGSAQGRGSPQPRAGGGGPKPGPARLPGDSGSTKCINCGKTGHSTQKCPEGRRDPKQRPCFQCGKTGHMKANCPQLSKPVNAMTESVSFGRLEAETDPRPQGGGGVSPKPAWPRQEEEMWTQPRRPAKAATRPMPRGASLGEYMQPSVFTRARQLEETNRCNDASDDSDSAHTSACGSGGRGSADRVRRGRACGGADRVRCGRARGGADRVRCGRARGSVRCGRARGSARFGRCHAHASAVYAWIHAAWRYCEVVSVLLGRLIAIWQIL